jgi:NAD(P)H-dependent flavin oxidoreductase YrpB (nitropropane dioxygenase family)
MARAALHTALCDLVGIEHPIVQTGMGWVAGARLASATANAGGLGIIASATMDLRQLEGAIAETRARTERPFGVNLRGDSPDGPERVALLIRERVRVVSFAGVPSERLIKRCKDAGLVAIQSVGARRHAEKVAAWGVDAVIAQGAEAGGHVGSVPTSVLLPQVVDAVGIPVVAAGGFFDGRGLVAALAFGAAGVAMGTRFLLTRDSPVPDPIKRLYLAAGVDATLVTSRVDGQPHRVLRTPFVERLERAGPMTRLPRALANAVRFQRMSGLPWRGLWRSARELRRAEGLSFSQGLQAANTPMLLRRSMVEGRADSGVMASGVVTGLIEDLPSCQELIEGMVRQAGEVLARLAA